MDFNLSGGTQIMGFISPFDTNDTYAVIDPLYGIGGFRNVSDLTELNAIPNERRRAGMVVGVSGGTEYYKLKDVTWSGTTNDWGIFQTTTSGGTDNGIYGGSGSLITGTTITNAGFDLGIIGTGNFGVGTITPTEKLEVVGGNSKFGGGVIFNSIGSGTPVTSLSVDTSGNVVSGVTGGEIDTASNVGGGNEIFYQKVGTDLQFRTLSGGSNVTITSGETTITINSSGGASDGNGIFDVGNSGGTIPTAFDYTLTDSIQQNASNSYIKHEDRFFSLVGTALADRSYIISQSLANTANNGSVFMLNNAGLTDNDRIDFLLQNFSGGASSKTEMKFRRANIGTGSGGSWIDFMMQSGINQNLYFNYNTNGSVPYGDVIVQNGNFVINNLGTGTSITNLGWDVNGVVVSGGTFNSLSTSGTSGPSTLIGGVLNIPIYSGSSGGGSDGNGIYDGSGSLVANTIIQQNAFNLELQGNGGLFTTNANTSWAIGAVLNSGFQVYQVVSTHSTGHYIIQTKGDVSSDVYGQRIYSNSAKTGAATLYGTHNSLVGTHALGTNVAGYFNAENALNNYSAVFDAGNIGFAKTAVALADAIKLIQSTGVITFDGTTGGLFSITDDKDGQLFGVADVSGNDIMYADADWLIKMGNPFQLSGSPFELYYDDVSGNTTLKTNAINVNLNSQIITSNGVTSTIDVSKSIIKVTSTTNADLLSIPNGVEGQIITLLYVSESLVGDIVTITPDNLIGFTTITMNNIGEGCELYFTDGSWIVKSNNGTVLA